MGVENSYAKNWKTQRYLIEDDLTYRLNLAPENVLGTRLSTVIYGLIGLIACIAIFGQADQGHPSRFLVYLVCANFAALGLRLTSAKSVLPAGFLFLMLGISDLSLPEVLFIAVSITLLREVPMVRRLADIKGLFYAVASITIGIAAARATYSMVFHFATGTIFPAPVIASAIVLIGNCTLAAMLLTKHKETYFDTYQRECQPLLPWFIATTYLAYLVESAEAQTGFHPALIALPLLITLDFGYRAWCEEIAERKEEVVQLHRNTLETLALTIDARDQTTHMHLRRVQVYALAIGRELGLNESELEALYIAALLHDIGKLGIPDHILLKPGSLTAPEWEKMKTHAEIGAEMLSRMRFPDLVSSLVMTHHEKWDGTGYPNGLSGTNIPIGSRILSAVDCLDALASDRPYRAALSLEEAMTMVRSQEGKSYDPAIISILERRYVELDKLAREIVGHPVVESADTTAGTPRRATGNLATRLLTESKAAIKDDIFDPIVAAREEDQLLKTLAGDLAQSVHLNEVVSAIHHCLSQKIHYSTMVIYVRHQTDLVPVYVLGEHDSLFALTPFPIGGGLSGWVAQHRSPILNGNVSIERSYSNSSLVLNNLQAALAVPFEGKSVTTGVIALYHLDRNAFSQDDLRILEAASFQIGPAIEGALRFREAEKTAETDHLTGVPNARALAKHLERELLRANRDQSKLGVLVCDLDGFKQVNDKFGHLAGDEVLRLVATGLQKACRGSDFLARIGGDEFVLVLPGLKEDYSDQLKRLQAVAIEVGQTVCGEQCLAMSIGMAIYPIDGHDAKTLIATADQHMYRVKHERKSSSKPNSQFSDDREPTSETLRGLSHILSNDQSEVKTAGHSA